MLGGPKHTPRRPEDPYRDVELPALAARAMEHAYAATAIGMPLLFVMEWFARLEPGFADDRIADAAVRCFVPAAVALVFAVLSRRVPVARSFPIAQGVALMIGIAWVLGRAAAPTGGMQSPYIISLQTMLYLWGLIVPGGLRYAIFPVLAAPVVYFGALAISGVSVMSDVRSMVAVNFTLASAVLSLAYAEVLERRRRDTFEASSIDSLSGLFNRRFLLERFAELEARAEENGSPLGVILLDVDEFKRINDTHGHAAGDLVIQAVAQVIRESIRATDLSGRFGGEEFAVILDGADEEAARRVGERIRETVEATEIHLPGGALTVTVSAGITIKPAGEARSLDRLLREADEALYRSKRAGRNRVTVSAG